MPPEGHRDGRVEVEEFWSSNGYPTILRTNWFEAVHVAVWKGYLGPVPPPAIVLSSWRVAVRFSSAASHGHSARCGLFHYSFSFSLLTSLALTQFALASLRYNCNDIDHSANKCQATAAVPRGASAAFLGVSFHRLYGWPVFAMQFREIT